MRNFYKRVQKIGALPQLDAGKKVVLWITNAALLITVAECLFVSFHDIPDAIVFISILNIISLNAVFLCAISFAAFIGLSALKDLHFPKEKFIVRILGGILFSLPHGYILYSTFPETGMVFYSNIAVFILLTAAGVFLGSRSVIALPWIVLYAFGSLISLNMLASSYYVLDINPHQFNMYFLFTTAVSLSAPLIGILLYGVFRSAAGRPVLLPAAILSVIVGLASCYFGLGLLPEISGTFLFYVIMTAFLAVVFGMVRLGPIRRLRYAMIGFVLTIAVQLFMVLAPEEEFRSRWTISTETVFPNLLVRYSFFSELTDRIAGDLIPQAEMTKQSNRWNQAAGKDRRYADDSILLITIDALRYRSVGYAGMELVPGSATPEIDKSAREFFRFHQNYTQGAWTSLAIPALFWGKYTNSIAFSPLFEAKNMDLFFENKIPKSAKIHAVYQSPKDEKSESLTQVLAAGGYKTIAVINDGKTTYFEKKFGFTRGFSKVFYPSGKKEQRKREIGKIKKTGSLDSMAADDAIDALDTLKKDKFFMWIHLYAPHQAGPNCFPGSTRLDCYRKAVTAADMQVGRILDKLRNIGKMEKTIVVISADHGQGLGEHREQSHGNSLYDEAVKIPLLIRLPDIAGRDIYKQSALIDIAPTILDYAGLDVPSTMQGFSLRPIIEGKTQRRPPIYMETWRREVKTHNMRLHLVGVVNVRYKLIADKLTGAYSFYDLRKDKAEKHNILKKELSPKNQAQFMSLLKYLRGYKEPIYIRR